MIFRIVRGSRINFLMYARRSYGANQFADCGKTVENGTQKLDKVPQDRWRQGTGYIRFLREKIHARGRRPEWCPINGYIATNSKVDVLEAAFCRERSEPNSIKYVTSSRTTDAIFSERNSLSKHDGLLLSGDSARSTVKWNGWPDGCTSPWWMIVY